MKFKKWLEMTDTSSVAGFSRRVGFGRRWWVSDWEQKLLDSQKNKKSKINKSK